MCACVHTHLSCGLFLKMPGLLLGETLANGDPDTERGRELGCGPTGEFTEGEEEAEEEEEMMVAVRGACGAAS